MRELIAALLLTSASAVHAADRCEVPAALTPAPAQAQEEQRLLPVTRLVLAYYWWPEQCRRDDQVGQPGCRAGFGFKVHGLWPDGAGRTYPQFCRAPTPLDVATVRANWCMTPSTTLLQHEWAKHGTCHWQSPADYFGAARRVATSIALPDAARLGGLFAPATAGALRDAVVKANPQVPRAAIFVGTAKKQWLTELRICLTLAYQPVACDGGDIGAPDTVPLRVRRR